MSQRGENGIIPSPYPQSRLQTNRTNIQADTFGLTYSPDTFGFIDKRKITDYSDILSCSTRPIIFPCHSVFPSKPLFSGRIAKLFTGEISNFLRVLLNICARCAKRPPGGRNLCFSAILGWILLKKNKHNGQKEQVKQMASRKNEKGRGARHEILGSQNCCPVALTMTIQHKFTSFRQKGHP